MVDARARGLLRLAPKDAHERIAQKPVVVVQIKNGKFTYSSTATGG
jgi:hypothetical protein